MTRKIIFIWAIVQLILVSEIAFAQSPKKNVILIAVDDLNDWIGAFGGHPQTKTPNIDKLASKGVVFTNASCASPVCNPSRTAFMLGRRPHETGITNNGDGYFREYSKAWVRNITTWPQYFGQKGFETVAQGKIFHTHGENKGEFQIVGPGGQGCNAGPSKTSVNNTKLEWSESNQSLTATGDYKSAEWCGNYLNKNHNKPFLMACGIFRPHLPHFAPKEFFDKMPAIDNIKLPAYLPNDRNDTYGGSNNVLSDVLRQGGERLWKEAVRAYLANVAFADACVGKLLDDLENSQYKNNTIVVLIGDHGWHLGEKDHFQKFTMWDRAIKTPMIIYDPVDGGSGICDKAVSLMDIFPTMLELTGTPYPSYETSGYSIAPLVKNPNAAWCGVALTTYGPGHNSIRTDRYRYIKYSNGKEELYDHQTDPNEWTNVASKAAFSSVLSEHRQLLNKMLNGDEQPLASCQTGSDNESPFVAIISPSNNDEYEEPAGISIQVSASDDDGSIAKVELYNGLNLIGAKNNAPYNFTWNNVSAGTYNLVAKAYDNENASSYSQTVVVKVLGDVVEVVNIEDLVVIQNTCEAITLTWSDMNYETGYRVRRKLPEDAVYTNLGDVDQNGTSYTDNTVLESTDYIYVVRPMVDGQAVANSNIVEVKTSPCQVEITNIDDLQAIPESCESVMLTWSDLNYETGYRVRRKLLSDEVYSNLGDVEQNGTTYLDNTVVEGEDYIYMVRPLVDGQAVALSNLGEVKTPPCVITGLSDRENDQIYVYPNPVRDDLYLSESVSWQLLDIAGQVLMQGKGDKISLAGLLKGTYLVRTENKVFRIMKN